MELHQSPLPSTKDSLADAADFGTIPRIPPHRRSSLPRTSHQATALGSPAVEERGICPQPPAEHIAHSWSTPRISSAILRRSHDKARVTRAWTSWPPEERTSASAEDATAFKSVSAMRADNAAQRPEPFITTSLSPFPYSLLYPTVGVNPTSRHSCQTLLRHVDPEVLHDLSPTRPGA